MTCGHGGLAIPGLWDLSLDSMLSGNLFTGILGPGRVLLPPIGHVSSDL